MAAKEDKTLMRLTKLWNFWIQFRWWLIVILIFLLAFVFYRRTTIGVGNALVFIVFFIFDDWLRIFTGIGFDNFPLNF